MFLTLLTGDIDCTPYTEKDSACVPEKHVGVYLLALGAVFMLTAGRYGDDAWEVNRLDFLTSWVVWYGVVEGFIFLGPPPPS
jgi:hypothetical protein